MWKSQSISLTCHWHNYIGIVWFGIFFNEFFLNGINDLTTVLRVECTFSFTFFFIIYECTTQFKVIYHQWSVDYSWILSQVLRTKLNYYNKTNSNAVTNRLAWLLQFSIISWMCLSIENIWLQCYTFMISYEYFDEVCYRLTLITAIFSGFFYISYNHYINVF